MAELEVGGYAYEVFGGCKVIRRKILHVGSGVVHLECPLYGKTIYLDSARAWPISSEEAVVQYRKEVRIEIMEVEDELRRLTDALEEEIKPWSPDA